MDKGILKNDFLQIEYLTDSLRIIGLTPAGKPNLLADLSELPPIPTPYGDFHFRGGHRLWHAPEAMPRTYIPDTALTITELHNSLILETQTEPGTGIRKRIEIRLAHDKPSLTLTHTLTNNGLWAVELAPWAITQFRLGGTVILPMPVGNMDAAGLLSNRQISLWPYARINDPRNPDFAVALQLRMPAEHLFTHRVWLGMVGVLCQLEATVPVAPVLRRWLPGFVS